MSGTILIGALQVIDSTAGPAINIGKGPGTWTMTDGDLKHTTGHLYFQDGATLHDLLASGGASANDGLSVSGSNVQLGQTIGASGDPAKFTESREIPMNTFDLFFKGGTINLGSHTPAADNDSNLWVNSNHLFVRLAGTNYQLDQQAQPTNPGVYFSPATALDPSFIVFASAIIRVNNTNVYNDIIQWQILGASDGHNSSFFLSAAGDASTKGLFIYYPKVKQVLNATITNDESFSKEGLFLGPSVAFDNMLINVNRMVTVGCRFTGGGALGAWTPHGASYVCFDMSAIDAGGKTGFNFVPAIDLYTDYDQVSITYQGPNNYGVQRAYSALGAYNAAFYLIDRTTGTAVTAPTSSDEIVITGGGLVTWPTNMYQFDNATNARFGTSYNFWVFGVFNCYLVAAALSSTSVRARWQAYPTATSYKLFRDTDPTFASQVLIYTGTNLSFDDTGLTTGNLYYYKLQAQVSGVYGDVSTFNAIPN